tara:strand:- start:134 stop:1057 length:924 start_codon:yes stop_codon:yes gene_type:complete
MAGLPSFLQAMFTPQSMQGPGQMAWRDVVNEDSGEFSTGDTQEMYWKPSTVTSRSISGPTTRRLPDPLPGTGSGPSPLAQIGRDMGELAGDGGEDMTSITEVMQSTPVGDEFGGAPAMGYVPPAVGGWADQGDPGMVSDPLFAPSEPSSLPSRPMFVPSEPSSLPSRPMFVPSEPSTLQGPASALSAGLTERQGVGYQTALPYKPPHTQALDFLKRHTASLAPQAGVGQTDPHTGVPAIIGDDFIREWWERGTGGGTPTPTPGIPPGQTDPALGVPVAMEPHWPEWLRNLFAKSTTGGASRGPRVRR